MSRFRMGRNMQSFTLIFLVVCALFIILAVIQKLFSLILPILVIAAFFYVIYYAFFGHHR